MNLTRIIILGIVFGLSACQSSDEKKTDASNADSVSTMKLATDSNVITAAIDSSTTTPNSAKLQGTYKGVLPCADCEGIETSIMLHADNSYMISTKYLGKKDSKEINGEGKFAWIDGTQIQLEGIKEGPSKYAISDGKIIQLDKDGKKVEGASAAKYILIKQNSK